MQTASVGRFKHKKLVIFSALLIVLIGGSFVYKYTYSYLERRKYDQAEVAIKKVAADLHAQGINTEFSRGCGRTKQVYGPGNITCSVSIKYLGSEKLSKASNTVDALIKYMSSDGFTLAKSYNVSFALDPAPTGDSVFTLVNNSLQCNVQLTNSWQLNDQYTFELYCGKSSRYKLF